MEPERLPDLDPQSDLIDACLTRYGQMMRALLHVRAASMMPWNEAHLTLPQIRVLSLLAGHIEGLSGRALASMLGVGPSAVTPLVDRLVDHGYVRRAEDRLDRRITRLLLTSEGATVLQQMAAGRREVLAEVLQHLAPEELETVERGFGLVALGVQRTSPTAEAALGACLPLDAKKARLAASPTAEPGAAGAEPTLAVPAPSPTEEAVVTLPPARHESPSAPHEPPLAASSTA
jgi:DNA-binding MarR family transcriptional regulator